MEYIIQDLDSRKIEIDKILDLILFIDKTDIVIDKNGFEFSIDSSLVKTTKGTVYLLLYSLVEATMRGAVVAIHDDITSSSAGFDELREELQYKIIHRARRDKIAIPEILRGTSGDISLGLHKATLKNQDLFAGNIDRDEIKKVAEIYGFSHNTEYINTGHGEQLDKVKRNRNDLSHGNKTFSVVGGELSIEELRDFSSKVISYMYEISDNIVDSLNGKLYLRDSHVV